MTYSFRPAVRVNTPLIIGIAGPTKSGKTYSAHRLAQGLANGGSIAMLNCEGARGHQYADKFGYLACDLTAPFSYKAYTEALQEVQKIKPAVLIIDSVSHAHDGPGGMLEAHDAEVTRMAGTDYAKRERVNMAAWIRPKAEENQFIYAMLSLNCPTILCFRAKEKIKIVKGQQPIDLGWQPIGSERIAFETIFTLMLPPHSKGIPDAKLSEMREPFDAMVSFDKQLDETLGRKLAAWAAGATNPAAQSPGSASTGQVPSPDPSSAPGPVTRSDTLLELCKATGTAYATILRTAEVRHADEMEQSDFDDAVAMLKRKLGKLADRVQA
jgi:hypothetical protein